MKKPSDVPAREGSGSRRQEAPDDALEGIIGLGSQSMRKNYYPQLQARLAELEGFRTLFDHGNDLLLVASLPGGRLRDANNPLCAALGLPPGRLLTLSLADLLPADLLPAFDALDERDSLHLETRLGDIPVEMTARVTTTRITGAAGPHRALLLVFRDITERLRSQKELRRAKEEAERASIAKSRFLASASHDLRQPYQAMTLFEEVLSNRLRDPDDLRVLARLREAIGHGRELLDALLDISVLDAGVLKPAIGSVALDGLLDQLAGEFTPQAVAQGIALRHPPTRLTVRSDPTLLARMLRNLLANALKYSPRSTVLLGCRRAGGAVRIEVWDDGPGIPAEKHEEIFEEFTQLANPERDRRKGLGLGLAIVARTARLLGHQVGLRSRPGCGSVFHITIPAADG